MVRVKKIKKWNIKDSLNIKFKIKKLRGKWGGVWD